MTDLDLAAFWDDSAFGAKHWRSFSRIALVTDHAWIAGVATMFAPFLPGVFRHFGLAQLHAAKNWMTAPPTVAKSVKAPKARDDRLIAGLSGEARAICGRPACRSSLSFSV